MTTALKISMGIALGIVLLLYTPVLICEEASQKRTGDTYTLFVGGDTMLARWVHQAVYRQGPQWMFEPVKKVISSADVALTNLECVVSTRGKFFDKGEGRPFLYRARPEMLDVLTEAGFDIVTTANNHAMDYGPDALIEQLELLEAAGISNVGSGRNWDAASTPTYMKVGEVILAFIGIEDYFKVSAARSNRPGTFHGKREKGMLKVLRNVVATARERADLVVFTPHWGANWTEKPTKKRIELAHTLIDMGVDAILGHSSHQIHGVEIYKGKPIVYDMGSLFFDTIGQKRMRFSAGYVLDFDSSGFKKLTIHPFYLQSNRVNRATGKNLERIHGLIKHLTKELDPELEYIEEGDALTVRFEPDRPPPPRKRAPKRIEQTGRTVRLPDTYRKRKTNVVVDHPPKWCEGFKPVKLDQGVTVLGYRHSEAVRPKTAFVSEVALSVSGPLKGRWESFLEGRQRGGTESFKWRHSVADGGWMPEIWQSGQIVIDRTLARPQKVDPGVYDLYWGIEAIRAKTRALPLDTGKSGTSDLLSEGLVPVGEIRIMKHGIPKGPAGVAWDGYLPDEYRVDKRVGSLAGISLFVWLAVACGAVILAGIILFFIWRRRNATRKLL